MDRTPRPCLARVRLVAPLAALALVLAGTTAAFASGAFESNDSGFDSAHDIAERGSAPDAPTASTSTSTTTTSSPADDRGVDATAAPVAGEDQSFVTIPDGTTQTFAAGDAGSVTVRRDGATLSVVTVNANAGWAPEVEQDSGTELEVNFENGVTRVDFNAELEDGAVRIRVRVRDGAAADAPVVVPAPAVVDDNSGRGSIDDNSGPGSGDDTPDDHSGHGSDGSDDGSGHSGSGDRGSGHGSSDDD